MEKRSYKMPIRNINSSIREHISIALGRMSGSAVSLVVVMSLKEGTLVSRHARADLSLQWSMLAYFHTLACHTKGKILPTPALSPQVLRR